MRSFHIIGSKLSGGAEMFYIRLVNALHESGHEVVAINRPRSMVSKQLDRNIEQLHVGMYNVRDPFSRYRIGRILRSGAPDVVQTYMGRATRLTHVPRGQNTIHICRLGGFYKLDGYHHADAWVGNTKSICDYLRENGFPDQRIFHIPNFVTPDPDTSPEERERIRKNLGIPEEALIVLGVGRFIPKKGFGNLIEAVSRLPETIIGRPVHLLLIGSGPEERSLVSCADRSGLTKRVHWGGWQTQPGPYYEIADVFVCPSLHEPLGNVILEAWSYGVPVISTRTHGAMELVRDGRNGLLVPCKDVEELARAIESALAGDRTVLEAMAENGRSEVISKYTREAVVRSYLELYGKLTAEGSLR